MDQPRLDRRTLLIAAAGTTVGLLTACSSSTPASTASAASSAAAPASPVPSPADVPGQVRSEAELIALYDAVIAAHPELEDRLAEIRDQHRDHARALGADEVPEVAPPADVPESAFAAQDMLAGAEREAARERADACVGAPDPDSARVLALIAASESSHAAFLRTGPG